MNPLLQALGPKGFKEAIEIYEADKALTIEERQGVINDMLKIYSYASLISIPDGILGFLLPSLVQSTRRQMAKSRGVVVPPTRFLQMPFLSAGCGLALMFFSHFSNVQNGMYKRYNELKQKVDDEKEIKGEFASELAKLDKENGLEVADHEDRVYRLWLHVYRNPAPYFAHYWRNPVKDANLPDPRLFSDEPHIIEELEPKEQPGHAKLAWDKVRDSNK